MMETAKPRRSAADSRKRFIASLLAPAGEFIQQPQKVLHLATREAPAEFVVRAGQHAVVLEEGRNERPQHESMVLTVERGATLTYAFALSSDAACTRELKLKLADGARAELFGFVRATGNGAVRMTLTEDHASGASWARSSIRAIVSDAAQLNVRGMITIDKAADRSDGFFEGRGVLFGDGAKAEIIPSLEIAAQDVKAGHAAAVGPIDPNQLFYLQSRGCTLQEAETLVLDGFLEQFLSKIPDEQLRAELRFRWLSPRTDPAASDRTGRRRLTYPLKQRFG